MRCKCGYDFRQDMIAGNEREHGASYAVIDDADYGKFIRSEAKVLRSRGEARQRAIAKSSRYVGTLHRCPRCSRLLLVRPLGRGKWTTEFYVEDVQRVESD